MKKKLVLLLLVLASATALAQNWGDFTPAPCPDVIPQGELSGPKEYKIRGDTVIWGGAFDPCINCEFTFVYYDNYDWIMSHAPGNYLYMISIVGVFYEGEGCKNCVIVQPGSYMLDAILRGFFISLYWTLNYNNPTFRGTQQWGDPQNFFTPGECKNGSAPCSSLNYCCSTEFNITRDGDGNPTGYNWDYYTNKEVDFPDCPAPCTFKCKDIPFQPLYFTKCDIPCNSGDWVSAVEMIPIPDCPGCVAKVEYEYRTTDDPNCIPPFKDYHISSMTRIGCSGCTMTGADMFDYCVSWLLKYGPHDQPPDGQCWDIYRVIHAKCWEWHNDDTFIPCEEQSGCCWSVYRICNPWRTGIDPELIERTSDGIQNCATPARACLFMCSQLQPRISPLDEEKVKNDKASVATIKPNPNNCTATMTVDNGFKGDITLEITNSLGELVIREKYFKTGYDINVSFSIANCTNGTYFYRIIQNDVKIGEGSFVVIK